MLPAIGEYSCLTPWRTAGSGSARWCIGCLGVERFFIKQFLSPVYPAHPDTPLGLKQLARCQAFEKQKRTLYAALSCVIGGVLVPVIDFFRYDGRYYSVSEALPDSCVAAEDGGLLPREQRRNVLFDLALCLQRLHRQGVVHGDLKPEHVLLCPEGDGFRTRLIDLDSGFLTGHPPREIRDMEGDPAYLSPEMFISMMGEKATLGTGVDTFAFAMMIHKLWTGELPGFDHSRYDYLYQAVLDGGTVTLSPDLPQEWQAAMQAMLDKDPARRPADGDITRLFEKSPESLPRTAVPANGLRRFMRSGGSF